MGIHTGTPLLGEEGYVGVDVHRAARIAACGHGGQVLVSASTRRAHGHGGLRDLGEHRLKDLSAPERLYQLGEGEFPPLTSLYRTNLPVPATPFLGREQELARGALRCSNGVAPADADRAGRDGQDPACPAGGRRGRRSATRTGCSGCRSRRCAIPRSCRRSARRWRSGAARAAPRRDARVSSSKRLLLLFDNVEHLLPQAGEDSPTCSQRAAGLTLLVTSRERLQLHGEQAYPVPPLASERGWPHLFARARPGRSIPPSQPRRRSRSSARASTTCPSRSSWRRRGRVSSRPSSCSSGSAGGSTCSRPDAASIRASRRSAPRSSGAYDLLAEDEQRLFCSPRRLPTAAAPSRRPRWSARPTSTRCSRWSTRASLRVATGPLLDAGDDPRVRGANGSQESGEAEDAPASPRRALPGARRGGGAARPRVVERMARSARAGARQPAHGESSGSRRLGGRSPASVWSGARRLLGDQGPHG